MGFDLTPWMTPEPGDGVRFHSHSQRGIVVRAMEHILGAVRDDVHGQYVRTLSDTLRKRMCSHSSSCTYISSDLDRGWV
jgi:hypothetical protein